MPEPRVEGRVCGVCGGCVGGGWGRGASFLSSDVTREEGLREAGGALDGPGGAAVTNWVAVRVAVRESLERGAALPAGEECAAAGVEGAAGAAAGVEEESSPEA